jgi:hypothetical protein
LLENVPQDFHVDEPALAPGRLAVPRARRAVVVGGQAGESFANLVGHRQPVEERVGREQPAVVALDAEQFAPPVDGPEQPPEVVPDRPGVIRVGVPVGAGDGLGRQQPAVLGEGDEQNAVEGLLRRRQQVGGRRGGVRAAQRLERPAAQVGVLPVVVARQVQADAVRLGQQVVEVTAAGRRDHALRPQQEDEPAEGGVVVRQGLRLEALVGELVVSLVVQARLPQVGDQIPVADEVDGVAQGLIDGGQLAAGEGSVERVARPLALQGRDVVRPAARRREPAQHGVGELAVHLDGLLAPQGVPVCPAGGAGVAEHIPEHVADEVTEQLGLLHRPARLRAEQAGPVAQLRASRARGRRDGEGLEPGAQGLGTEEGLDRGGHDGALGAPGLFTGL